MFTQTMTFCSAFVAMMLLIMPCQVHSQHWTRSTVGLFGQSSGVDRTIFRTWFANGDRTIVSGKFGNRDVYLMSTDPRFFRRANIPINRPTYGEMEPCVLRSASHLYVQSQDAYAPMNNWIVRSADTGTT